MKYSSIATIAVLLAFLSPATGLAETAGQGGKHLFILSGQSNMGALDPNLSFTPLLEATFGKDNVVVIKDAQGGQPIRRWYKGWKPEWGGDDRPKLGELYDRLMQKVLPVVKREQFATVTFVWMQGERDANDKRGSVYRESLEGLLRQLANDLGRDDMQFVIGRLSDYGLNKPDWMLVREVQVAVAESSPRGAWVDTDDLNDGVNRKGVDVRNDLHFSVKGYAEFGKRLAEQAIRLIRRDPGLPAKTP